MRRPAHTNKSSLRSHLIQLSDKKIHSFEERVAEICDHKNFAFRDSLLHTICASLIRSYTHEIERSRQLFHMMSTFDLKKGQNVSDFRKAMVRLYDHLKSQDLVQSYGPICERFADTPMDTDDHRPFHFFFVTTFKSQKQCDDAYAYINRPGSEVARLHGAMMSKVADDAVFSCWAERTEA